MRANESEELILELNYKNEIICEKMETGVFNSEKMFELLPETIVDKRTLEVIEIHDLFKAVDHSATAVGAARLFHSLVNPSQSIESVYARQDAYWELASNVRLQEAIVEFLENFAAGEGELFKFLNAHMHPLLAYGDYQRAMRTINNMMGAIEKLPAVETVYLDSLVQNIRSFIRSPCYEMANGSVIRTMQGVIARSEKKGFFGGLPFHPRRLGFGALWPSFPAVFFGAAWGLGLMQPAVARTMFYATSFFSGAGLLYGMLLKPMIDYETAVLPVRKRFIDSYQFATAVEAVAAIDELLSFVRFGQEMPHPTVMPEITNEESHFFVARDLRNPLLARHDKNFVANDVELTGARMTFITGPNSGGKTTYCKTIVQNQILGQIGAPVVASNAMMNMADMIVYQAPHFDTLSEEEGRFGTELKVTRDIFYSVTPQSLAILDEIAEGTTSHEKLTFSVEIMKGFYAIGNNTLLVTHSFELVESFMNQGLGQYLQVEFDGDIPTHKMVPGVSRDSHAHRVAEKIGFSPEDMRRYLRQKGYLDDGGEGSEEESK